MVDDVLSMKEPQIDMSLARIDDDVSADITFTDQWFCH